MNFQEFDLFSVYSQVKSTTNKEQFSTELQNELILKAIRNLRNRQENLIFFNEQENMNAQTKDINIPLKQNVNRVQNIYNDLIDQKELSDTISLSFISDKVQQLNIRDCLLWFEDFKQYGQLFQPLQRLRSFIKTNKFDNILSNNFKIQIYSGYDTELFIGFNVNKKDWIVVKEQIVPQDFLINSAQQFIIHNQIYQLYPEYFVELLLPVYIEENTETNKFKFVSQLEYGEINLYDYSQQNKVLDLEFQYIFQQVYQQINLLHKHNIAHRDIKPQNIIYVENKGWVLCDFGDSIKYQNVNGIYEIRGTYAFLQPNLQQYAYIQRISIKQNLYENDIYALGISLIIIKYQIKHQDEIQEYINKAEDYIIQQLIKNPNRKLDNLSIKNEIPFIKAQIQLMNSSLSNKDIGPDEITNFIQVLRNFEYFDKLKEDFKFKIINLIDETLAHKGQYLNETSIICYVGITKYVKNLNHLIKYKYLRQGKFWKQFFRGEKFIKYRKQKIDYIICMYNLGLTEVTLYYARQFIQNDYDFIVHIIIILILLRLREYDLVQQEYDLILIYKDFKQMNPFEYECFSYLTLRIISWDSLNNEDVKFIQYNTQFMIPDLDPYQFQEEQYNDKEFSQKLLQNLVQKFNKSIQKQDVIEPAFEFLDFFYNHINISAILDIIGLFKENIKYICTTFDWYKLLSEQTQIIFYLKKSQIKRNLKEMNYVLLFNSESNMQFNLLKIIKLLNLHKQGIKKFTKYQRIQKQIKNIIVSQYFITTFHVYRKRIICEFLFLNYLMRNDAIFICNQGLNYKYQFQTLICIAKQENIISSLTVQDKFLLIKLIECICTRTLNYRRYYSLYKEGQHGVKKNGIKNSLINFSLQNDFKTLLSLKMLKPLEKQFIEYQYIFSK